MAELTGTVDSIGLAKLVELVMRIARDDSVLRQTQAQNALSVAYSRQATLTDAAIEIIQQAQSNAETFALLQVFFDTTAGTGRYDIDGSIPSAAGAGLPIPSGGAIISVIGNEAIRNFKMIAETGQTLPFKWLVSK